MKVIKNLILTTLVLLTISYPVSANTNLDGYNIKFTNKNINEIELYKDKKDTVVGTTDYSRKNILVTTNMDNKKVIHTMLHEIGHAIDSYSDENYAGQFSDTTEFEKIYEKEEINAFRSKNNKNYYRRDIHEYFAESFVLYIENNAEFIKDQPATYKYIENILERGDIYG